ncbi:hypothetical protein COX58_02800 [archaeon CG_4_10_14_0_2_um_filter_Archaea_38_6]|nr:MAG: hypothetical protein COS83_04450 [archaeon CG07_land_8_20_14_0_80_38_8]PIU89248.1 MAG: hypothetical protein COS64_01530 [archaeon CG06_land_8_20_14_3_00_37_11]PJA22108.1 MAG: hypothetical protein COX58_02800 [archaeon CG_4_10_14_0_2_um_filter_Archaea_38_6]
MKSKIVDKNDNPLMKREEVRIEIEHFGEKTPDRKIILAESAKLLNKDEKLISVNKIRTFYGESKCMIRVHVYKNSKDLENNEPKYLIKRNTFEEKKEEAKPEEKKEEKQAAAKPEEVKSE